MPKLGTTCPNCQTHITRLKTKSAYSFCPSCDVLLYKKPKVSTPLSKTKKLFFSFFLALFAFIPLIIEQYPYLEAVFTVIAISGVVTVLTVIIAMMFLRYMAFGNYKSGVDLFKDMQGFVNKYYSVDSEPLQCKSCHSFKMTSFQHYKHELFMNDEAISNLESIQHNQKFRGCLNCSAQYNLDVEKKSYFFRITLVLLIVFNVAYGFSPNKINQLVALLYSAMGVSIDLLFFECLVVFFYILLISYLVLSFSAQARTKLTKI